MRRATIDRRTSETRIALSLTLEGRGRYDVRTGIRFFDHMLELVARHGGFDLMVSCDGDLDVDQHHTVEDVGLAFGEAVRAAIGNKRGINRAGYFLMPMDAGGCGDRSVWAPRLCRQLEEAGRARG